MHDEVAVLGLTRRSRRKALAADDFGPYDDHGPEEFSTFPGGPADDRFLDRGVWSDDPSACPDRALPAGSYQQDTYYGQSYDEDDPYEGGSHEDDFYESGLTAGVGNGMPLPYGATANEFFEAGSVESESWIDSANRPPRLGIGSQRRPVRVAVSVAAVLLVATVVGNSSGGSPQQTSASEGSEATTTLTPSGTAEGSTELLAEGVALRSADDKPANSETPAPPDEIASTDGQSEADSTGISAGGAADPSSLPADEGEPDGPDPDAASSGVPTPASPSEPDPSVAPGVSSDYASNLALIKNQTVRNRNQDASPYQATPSAQLDPTNHYGPRTDYLNNPGGNPEQSFPVEQGGQFRVGCEFSHFSYDDPLVFPNQPGAAHLHMFFGNTDVNAFSTADSILNTGSSTCNGQELNRSAYWAPAMFDGAGNVRIPERVVIYYKGEGLARTNAEPFPDGAAMIASADINTISPGAGGAAGKFNFVCSDNYSGASQPAANTMPNCDGNRFGGLGEPYSVLEMNVKFPQCWNGQDPSNPDNFRHPSEGGWYFSLCNGAFNHTFVNLEYFINYKVEAGESTKDWYLASDIDPATGRLNVAPGSSIHADWWGGWHKQTNQTFLENCVRYKNTTRSGCGFGYLTDGGPNGESPANGPALKYRPQFTGPTKVPASQLFAELCPGQPAPSSPAAAAYCHPGGHSHD